MNPTHSKDETEGFGFGFEWISDAVCVWQSAAKQMPDTRGTEKQIYTLAFINECGLYGNERRTLLVGFGAEAGGQNLNRGFSRLNISQLQAVFQFSVTGKKPRASRKPILVLWTGPPACAVLCVPEWNEMRI